MLNLVAVLIIVVATILAGTTAWRLVCGWLKYRGRMVITCPENQRPAGVSVDARHAGATSRAGKPEFSPHPLFALAGECSRQMKSPLELAVIQRGDSKRQRTHAV